jgi:hypothetical protein
LAWKLVGLGLLLGGQPFFKNLYPL